MFFPNSSTMARKPSPQPSAKTCGLRISLCISLPLL
jgi:hypothetical protein